jgi:hypothetical protein
MSPLPQYAGIGNVRNFVTWQVVLVPCKAQCECVSFGWGRGLRQGLGLSCRERLNSAGSFS